MDELDHNLLDAWHRVFELCKANPAEARRRYERVLPGTTLDRPVRAWCVALRASDTRLNEIEGAVHSSGREPGAGGYESQGGLLGEEGGRCASVGWGGSGGGCSGLPPGALAAGGEGFDPIGAQAAHEIVLDGWALRQLGGAVDIPYPGLPIDEAARLLGKHKEALRNWMSARPGRTRAARAESAVGHGYDDHTLVWQEHPPTAKHPLGVRYVPQRILGRGDRGGGMETPVVWSEHALDAGAAKGRPPARWWGSLWKSLADKIPIEFEQVVERLPRFVPYPEKDGSKRPRFRGWWWRCPGLGSAGAGDETAPSPSPSLQGGEFEEENFRGRGCGRQVATLYAPLPVWTVGRYYGLEEGLEVEGLSGQWLPGVMDRWAGRRRLACEHCWKPRRTSFANYKGWNEFVTHLSGGLLFGHEVQKPADFEFERRQAYVKRPQKGVRPSGGESAGAGDGEARRVDAGGYGRGHRGWGVALREAE